MSDLTNEARAAAFRQLLETGRPVTVAQIAWETKADPIAVDATLHQLEQAGRIRRDADGNVAGSAGLSVVPAAHELWLGARRFWTWCAYDIVGIVAAVRADAQSLSRSPASGAEIRLRFRAGHPPATQVALFLPDDRGCARTIDDWCANANFFENREAPSPGPHNTKSRARSSSWRKVGAGASSIGLRSSEQGIVMTTTVDVIVLGTGSAAQTVAYRCREAGRSVVA